MKTRIMYELKLKTSLILFILTIFTFSSLAQISPLKLEEIMCGNSFIGYQPTDYVWDAEGQHIYFRWNPEQALNSVFYDYDVAKKVVSKVKFDANNPVPLNGMLAATASSASYFKIGNSLYRVQKGFTDLIYSNSTDYQILKIHKDLLYFRQNNNVYRFSPKAGTLVQLTNFKAGSAPQEFNKTSLSKEEYALFTTLRDKEAEEMDAAAYQLEISPKTPSPLYLKGQNLDEIMISDQGNYIAYVCSKKSASSESTSFMQYITENGYAQAKNARSKVGQEGGHQNVYYYDTEDDTVVQCEFNHLSDLNRIPTFYQDYPDSYPNSYKKELIFHLHGFNATGSRLLIEIKADDNKDRWIGYIDLQSGKFIETHHQHDEAWIGGPGIVSWNSVPGTVSWTTNDSYFFQDEKTGYSHLYLYSTESKTTIQLTEGDFEVHEAVLSHDKKSIYITANITHPGNRDFYQLNLADKKLTPLLNNNGRHDVILSPTEDQLLISYSYKNKPGELYIAKNESNTEMLAITNSQSAAFKSYDWRAPEIINFDAQDGQSIHARIYEPTESTKNGAAVLFVHGAGYLQNAHNWWSSYYREYMFHNFLCDLGYTVLDVDYRASEGYGRDFRTAIYRHMGGKDLSDFVDARSFLINEKGIDSARVGIYGGSYGGFITLMALLTEPGKFNCGAAIRSVTDWAHYNHAYTANILNTPTQDPIAYKRSSPIYFAENLEDRLLMLHGMVDDNVQYQDVVRLSQRFIELGKTNWDLIGYPVEPHGFKETSSWIDEYGRILKLFNQELLNH